MEEKRNGPRPGTPVVANAEYWEQVMIRELRREEKDAPPEELAELEKKIHEIMTGKNE